MEHRPPRSSAPCCRRCGSTSKHAGAFAMAAPSTSAALRPLTRAIGHVARSRSRMRLSRLPRCTRSTCRCSVPVVLLSSLLPRFPKAAAPLHRLAHPPAAFPLLPSAAEAALPVTHTLAPPTLGPARVCNTGPTRCSHDRAPKAQRNVHACRRRSAPRCRPALAQEGAAALALAHEEGGLILGGRPAASRVAR